MHHKPQSSVFVLRPRCRHISRTRGQQRTSKYAASLETQNDKVQQDALRGVIGANVNTQYFSTSVKNTKEQGRAETRSDQKYSNLSYLGMSAIGGDPLIGSEYITSPIQVYVPAEKLKCTQVGEYSRAMEKLAGH